MDRNNLPHKHNRYEIIKPKKEINIKQNEKAELGVAATPSFNTLKSQFQAFRAKHAKKYFVVAIVSFAITAYFIGGDVMRQKGIKDFSLSRDINCYVDDALKNKTIKKWKKGPNPYQPHPQLIFNDEKQHIVLVTGGESLQNATVWLYKDLERDESGLPQFDKEGLPIINMPIQFMKRKNVNAFVDKISGGLL